MFAQKFSGRVFIVLLSTTLLLTACNLGAAPSPTLDVNAVNTAIVGTTIAQFSAQQTQTALAVPPTSTPAPTNTPQKLPTFSLLPTLSIQTTPLPGFTQLSPSGAVSAVPSLPASGQVNNSTASGCNDAAFAGETLPDGSVIKAGAKFTKAWQLQNTGTCTWDAGYTFAFLPDVSPNISGYDITIKDSDTATKPGHSQSFVVKLTAPTTAGEYKGYWRMKDKSGTFFGPRVYFDIVVK
jgi:hypothetical protein